MAFSEFTLEQVEQSLGIRIQEIDLFPGVTLVPLPDWLPGSLARGTRLALISEMVAANQFNERADRAGSPVFGCVTTGEDWQFLKLAGSAALLDQKRYYINDVGDILGALLAIVREAERT